MFACYLVGYIAPGLASMSLNFNLAYAEDF